MEKLFASFIDTLNLILLPIKESEKSCLDLAQSKLEELEGDYHTFFYKANIQKLYNTGYISDETAIKIGELKNRIDNIDNTIWNPKDFINNDEWKKIRGVTLEILNYFEIDPS